MDHVYREPALSMAVASVAVQLLTSVLLGLSIDQQGVLNAVTVALFGLLTVLGVSRDRAMPALLGLLKAAVACALAFGLHLDPAVQSSIMVTVTALAAAYTRTQVIPLDESSSPVPVAAAGPRHAQH